MRAALLLLLAALVGTSPCDVRGASPAEESRLWLEEILQSAKQARHAIVSTGDLALLDEELANARELEGLAAHLPFPEEDKKVCAGAARAVVDFITAAKVGNMNSGPASYERQRARWESLAERCRAVVVAYDRAQKSRAPVTDEKVLGTLAAAMITVEGACRTVNATPTFTRFMAENAVRLAAIKHADDRLVDHIAAARRQFDEIVKVKGCCALADQLNASEEAKAVGWVLFAGF